MKAVKEDRLGTMEFVLQFIASRGWITQPKLSEHPLLIVRASNACGESYTNADLESLYDELLKRAPLRSFEEMTAADYTHAMKYTNQNMSTESTNDKKVA